MLLFPLNIYLFAGNQNQESGAIYGQVCMAHINNFVKFAIWF